MTIPDLDELIAEVDRTCDLAGRPHRGEPDQPDWLALTATAVRIASELQTLADDLVEDYVEHCRMHGYSASDIGAVLGAGRETAQQRFIAPHKRYRPDDFTEELRSAMAETRQIAIQCRNHYVGTKHLLWSLTSEENSAIRMLERHGVSVPKLRHELRTTFSMGASQAAERVAFTPYSRKALAIADELASHDGSVGIDCHHVIIGLVDVGRGVAASLLRKVGIDSAVFGSSSSRALQADTSRDR
jgi:hypothetical protein